MRNTEALQVLSARSADQLGILYGIFNDKALVATTHTGRTRAMNQREAVGNEASRRGYVIRKLANRRYGCGPLKHFEPIP